MELPELGQHCDRADCGRLDFLPLACQLCSGSFCAVHHAYSAHQCPRASPQDVRVPVCPLCQTPCPVRRELAESPDSVVGRHLDNHCRPERLRRQAARLRCQRPKCRIKELVPIVCQDCRLNFCLTHRHPEGHQCQGLRKTQAAQAEAAALRRASMPARPKVPATAPGSSNPGPQSLAQPGLSQEEADRQMALALSASLNGASSEAPALSQEELDRLMALTLSESLNGATHPTPTQPAASTSSIPRCQLS